MHLRCDFFGESLQLSTSMTVLLPQATTSQIGMSGVARDTPAPVLYLLHGLSDDDTVWMRRTSIERYAAELGIAVVMPQVHRSFYADMVHGGHYWEFISTELPALVADSFRVSTAREDTFVAGLSMGGYGAFMLALRQPERFAAAGSLSGALDLTSLDSVESPDDPKAVPDVIDTVWGGADLAETNDNPRYLVSQPDLDPATLPPLWQSCGTEDFLLAGNRSFERAARDRGVDLHTEYHQGEHEWGYWDTHIQRFLNWLPLN